MPSFLNQPYPAPSRDVGRILLRSIAIGAFVAGFLIVFKPFGTDRVVMKHLNLFLAGYGVVIAACLATPGILFPKFFPKVTAAERWTVGRQLLFVFLPISIAITASYFYLLQLGGTPKFTDYFYFFRNGLLVAAFPVVITTLLDYIRKLRYYESGAAAFQAERVVPVRQAPRPGLREVPLPHNSAPAAPPSPPKNQEPAVVVEPVPPPPTAFTLTNSQGQEELTLPAPAALWCLHSDGNYVEVWHVAEGTTGHTRTLIRNTITQLTKQLPGEGFVVCHRSWVVNGTLVESVTGNAQGYQLHRGGAPAVPVSRGRSKPVLARLRELDNPAKTV